MTYTERAAVAVDEGFRNRVAVAMMTAAVTSAVTPKADDESDYSYKQRVIFALDVIYKNRDDYTTAAVWALVWNPAGVPGLVDVVPAAADLTDAGDLAIQLAVNKIFSVMSQLPVSTA